MLKRRMTWTVVWVRRETAGDDSGLVDDGREMTNTAGKGRRGFLLLWGFHPYEYFRNLEQTVTIRKLDSYSKNWIK